MTTLDPLDSGLESYERQDWERAFSHLVAADRETPLRAENLERLAIAAHLLGNYEDSDTFLARTHHEALREGDPPRAARVAFWLSLHSLLRGEMAISGGWLARANTILDEHQADCVERGFLLLPRGLLSHESDPARALTLFGEAASVAERFRDPDLMAFSRLGRGQSLLHLGRTPEGIAFFDEAMLSVANGEVSPIVAGIIYCGVIESCQRVFDLRRAREWTSALSRWCDSQPGLVSYRGQCLAYRAEIMQLHGAWQDAMTEARNACQRLTGDPAVGAAFYRQAELHRLRGEFKSAENDYRQASQWGRQPEPGLALLRLAQEQVDAAAATIRRALDEAHELPARANLLPAFVEIMLAAGDVPAARKAADELESLAAHYDAPLLDGMSAHATGIVLLAEGDAASALGALRRAWSRWHELEVPYEAARVRLLTGLVCRQLGDEDTAQMEFDAARLAFQQLGAAPDLARVADIARKGNASTPGGLTPRELEVLRLIAAGCTNRAIASELVISEKTVARHVSNIFARLDVASRSAATAYAYQHDLL